MSGGSGEKQEGGWCESGKMEGRGGSRKVERSMASFASRCSTTPTDGLAHPPLPSPCPAHQCRCRCRRMPPSGAAQTLVCAAHTRVPGGWERKHRAGQESRESAGAAEWKVGGVASWAAAVRTAEVWLRGCQPSPQPGKCAKALAARAAPTCSLPASAGTRSTKRQSPLPLTTSLHGARAAGQWAGSGQACRAAWHPCGTQADPRPSPRQKHSLPPAHSLRAASGTNAKGSRTGGARRPAAGPPEWRTALSPAHPAARRT